MDISFEVRFTPEAPAYLVAQGCGGGIVNRFARRQGRHPQDELKVNSAYRDAILQEYVRRSKKHFDLLSKHVPSPCRRFLDIGCGLALVSLFIWRGYRASKGDDPTIILFDGHVPQDELRTIDRPGGFHTSAEGYRFCSSVFEAQKLLEFNGVPRHLMTVIETPGASLQSLGDVDLVFSRRS